MFSEFCGLLRIFHIFKAKIVTGNFSQIALSMLNEWLERKFMFVFCLLWWRWWWFWDIHWTRYYLRPFLQLLFNSSLIISLLTSPCSTEKSSYPSAWKNLKAEWKNVSSFPEILILSRRKVSTLAMSFLLISFFIDKTKW